VFAQALNVARWIIVLRGGLLCGIYKIENAVKADGRPPEGVQSYLKANPSLEQDGY
jgi:hypothetical protein